MKAVYIPLLAALMGCATPPSIPIKRTPVATVEVLSGKQTVEYHCYADENYQPTYPCYFSKPAKTKNPFWD